VAALGVLGGGLVAAGGAGLALFFFFMRAPTPILLVPLLLLSGGVGAVTGARLVWRGLQPEGDGAIQRGLSRLTLALMAGGVPGIITLVGLLKSWIESGADFLLRDAGIVVILACPLVLAFYVGFVGMRIRIALRGFAPPTD
jgi:hypothetical protein